jgi:hypothetical protein
MEFEIRDSERGGWESTHDSNVVRFQIKYISALQTEIIRLNC